MTWALVMPKVLSDQADTRRCSPWLSSRPPSQMLLPPGPGQVVGAAEVAAKYFQWFGDADLIRVESVLVEPLADRISVRYRFQLHEQERWEVIEQQTYLD